MNDYLTAELEKGKHVDSIDIDNICTMYYNLKEGESCYHTFEDFVYDFQVTIQKKNSEIRVNYDQRWLCLSEFLLYRANELEQIGIKIYAENQEAEESTRHLYGSD